MKLRNKKTGEIGQIGYVATSGGEIIVEDISGDEYPYSVISSYKTLAELNEEWEDYAPIEPLIKDEKIRKAVKAWADADGADEKIYLTIDENGSRFANKYGGYIEFAFQIDMDERLYTIVELCGSEE